MAPWPLWASESPSGLYHRGLGQAVMVFPPPALPGAVVPAGVELGEHMRWARPGDRLSLTPLLILSKDASSRGGGRIGPDIKGPARLVL